MSDSAVVEPGVVSERVAGEIHPIAVRQARDSVIRQGLVIAAFVLSTPLAGFTGASLCFTGLLAVLVVTTIYDFRWWLWIRHAEPVEAFTRMQARTGLEGGAVRSSLTAVVMIAALGLLWFFGR